MKYKILAMSLCLTSSAFAADIQSAADEMCQCLEAPYKMIEQAMADMKDAQASGDYSKLTESQDEIAGVVESGSKCVESLPAKYPEIDKSEALQVQVMEIVNQQCPNPMSAYMPQ